MKRSVRIGLVGLLLVATGCGGDKPKAVAPRAVRATPVTLPADALPACTLVNAGDISAALGAPYGEGKLDPALNTCSFVDAPGTTTVTVELIEGENNALNRQRFADARIDAVKSGRGVTIGNLADDAYFDPIFGLNVRVAGDQLTVTLDWPAEQAATRDPAVKVATPLVPRLRVHQAAVAAATTTTAPKPQETRPNQVDSFVFTIGPDGTTGGGGWSENSSNAEQARVVGEIRNARFQLNTFWADQFTSGQSARLSGEKWEDVTEVKAYLTVDSPACGYTPEDSAPRNAFYCPLDHTVAFDLDWFQSLEKEYGGGAVNYLIFAHEWGHVIQGNANLLDGYSSKQIELGADCFAGVFITGATNSGQLLLSDADRKQMLELFAIIADEAGVPDYAAHGTKSERQGAYQLGLQGSADACMDRFTPKR